MLKSINFMKIDKKSIVKLQIYKNFTQELLSYFELRYCKYRATNCNKMGFYNNIWHFKRVFKEYMSKLAQVGGNWLKLRFYIW